MDSGSGCSCATGPAAGGFGVYGVLLAAALIRRSGRRLTRYRT
jgi:MYXO-CTERM domain-containing protein